jgi:hypothetical protein
VRKQAHESRWYDRIRDEYVVDTNYTVTIPREEWQAVVPMKETNHGLIPVDPFYHASPLRKVAKVRTLREYDEVTETVIDKQSTLLYDEWLAVTKIFLALARTPADDPDQHEKFRQAFVWLVFFTVGAWTARHREDLRIEDMAFGKRMDEIIFKYHSEEVFERVPAKHGVVPNLKYESWVTRESE